MRKKAIVVMAVALGVFVYMYALRHHSLITGLPGKPVATDASAR